MATAKEQLEHIARDLYEHAHVRDDSVMHDLAAAVSGVAHELVPGDAQANALRERCRRNRISFVSMDPDGGSPGQGLPNGYIFVVEQGRERGFEVGIAPDGSVSS